MVRLKKTREKSVRILSLVFKLSSLIGPLVWLIYYLCDFHINVTQKETLATITGAFSFTMTGFLAAMATMMFAISGKTEYKEWVRIGYGKLLVEIYLISLICLGVTFFASISVFFTEFKLIPLKLAISMLFTNLFQISLCTMIIIKRATKIS